MMIRNQPALVIAVATALLLVSAPVDAQRDRCATVELPGPVILPDGSMHRAMMLRLCLRDLFTPVTGLHEIQLDGRSLGLFLSRIDASDGVPIDAPAVVFQRADFGAVLLLGYAWPQRATTRTFALQPLAAAGDRVSLHWDDLDTQGRFVVTATLDAPPSRNER